MKVIFINNCGECPYLFTKDGKYWCKIMEIGESKLKDIEIIHSKCPLLTDSTTATILSKAMQLTAKVAKENINASTT